LYWNGAKLFSNQNYLFNPKPYSSFLRYNNTNSISLSCIMKRFNLTLFLFFLSSFVIGTSRTYAADSKLTREQYISNYKDDAVRDMKKTGVPASITLAQACLESQDGNSPLALEANNHFGIKCANWTGDTYIQDDDTRNECFRKYKDVLQSYDDHSDFLRTRPRYAELFLLDITDYISWAKGLKKAGYATNPQYADRLIKIIEDNKLNELDHGRDLPAFYEPVASARPQPVLKKNPATTAKIIVPSSEVINPFGGHQVFFNNETPYVIASAGDTYRGIADEFEMGEWQILKYNEVDKSIPVDEGEKIYLKPKRRTGERSFYTVKPGQSLHDIAQEQGIKMRHLLKWNEMGENADVKPGQRIYLQSRKS
jgi:LysM repeat protein